MTVRILKGDCREVLRTLPDESVHCVVTSPPYWGLRDYGADGQIGLEASYAQYIETMVAVFLDVRRVLRSDGTLWLNLGDSYATGAGRVGLAPGGGRPPLGSTSQLQRRKIAGIGPMTQPNRMPQEGLKSKDLVGMPWRVAFALQACGWWLRSDIIWHKPNPMPESVLDRPTSAHEHIFLLAKSEQYFYDADAVREPRTQDEDADGFRGGSYVAGEPGKRARSGNVRRKFAADIGRPDDHLGSGVPWEDSDGKRNLRNVWSIGTLPFKEAHFATFPPALIEPCILAGCPRGGTVLDPFGGAGTTGMVADRHGRDAILIEINPDYAEMAERRIKGDAGMFAAVAQI